MKKFLLFVPTVLNGSSILDLYVNGVSPFNVDLPFTSAYYYTDVNTETGPTYFSGIPEAYEEPGNFVDGAGSWIIPDTPTTGNQQPPPPIYNPPPEISSLPDLPEGEVPEPNNIFLALPILLGIILWKYMEKLSAQR